MLDNVGTLCRSYSEERDHTMSKWIAGVLMMAGIVLGSMPNDAAASGVKIAVVRDRIAVVYFSWSPSGNTRFAAETIARKTDGRLFEIKAKTPYAADYKGCCDEAKPECYGKQLRPILPVEGLDLAHYDVIFVGTPNWWGTMAPPVRTFLTENATALRGKVVCLFQTNGGGGMQRCAEEFSKLLPGAKILPAAEFTGSTIRDNVSMLEKFVDDRIILK